MTDAMSDVNEYWDRRCGDCRKKYPDVHESCKENAFSCKLMGVKNKLVC